MHKPAPADHPILEAIRLRWSPRAFADKPVANDVLASLFEAARWAPSSYNAQPWSYIVATRDEKGAYARLLNCLVAFNQVWAKTAPVLFLSVARMSFPHDDQPNRHAFHDVGMATLSLALEAIRHGLYVHQMAGFDATKARQAFAIPDGYEPVAAVALGYPGDPSTLDAKLRERELAARERRPFSAFVFGGRWGEPLRL
jgi:nitroreductase